MFFSICNDIDIRNHSLKGTKSILIRVLEPSFKTTNIPYEINNIDEYKAVLELYIQDSTLDYIDENSENVFNYKKSKLLNDFVINNDFDEIVVHCSLGISRSPAIMICVAKILDNSELENLIKEKYRHYNLYIVDTFEKSNYSIKKIDSDIEIEGNILEKRNSDDNEHRLIKILV